MVLERSPTPGADVMRKDEKSVQFPLPNYATPEEFISAIRAGAKGLKDPMVHIDYDFEHGDYQGIAFVQGIRKMTTEEKRQKRSEERVHARNMEERERAELRRLREKYPE